MLCMLYVVMCDIEQNLQHRKRNMYVGIHLHG